MFVEFHNEGEVIVKDIYCNYCQKYILCNSVSHICVSSFVFTFIYVIFNIIAVYQFCSICCWFINPNEGVIYLLFFLFYFLYNETFPHIVLRSPFLCQLSVYGRDSSIKREEKVIYSDITFNAELCNERHSVSESCRFIFSLCNIYILYIFKRKYSPCL